jgi:hypothetical protein
MTSSSTWAGSYATATCPADTTLVGGGGGIGNPYYIDDDTNTNTKILSSYPSADAVTGDPPPGVGTAAWTVVANSNDYTGSDLDAYAVCSTDPESLTTEAVTNSANAATSGGHVPAGESVAVTATCGSGYVLLDGGGILSPSTSMNQTGNSQQGVHTIGDYPSSGTTPVTDTSATQWTYTGEDGGQYLHSLGDEAVALCTDS